MEYVLKIEFVLGQTPISIALGFTDVLPLPDHRHADLKGVRPLSVESGGKRLYPLFQRDGETNVLYENIARCLKCFRDANPAVHDLYVLLWFFCPNEDLAWKTPLGVWREQGEDPGDRIVKAAERDVALEKVMHAE